MLRLQTDRLDLVAGSEQAAQAAKGGIRQLESIIGVKVAQPWFEEEGSALMTYYAYLITANPNMIGYGLWLIIERADKTMIGTAGFKGLPDDNGMIEIGYGIDAHYRRQGYTFEAARALIDWAFTQPGVRVVTAECLTNNLGSIRVLEKLGMERTGIVGSYIKWRLPKPEAAAT